MVELKGTLGPAGLPEIVQLIGELHHSGSLEVRKNGAQLVLGFDEGRLVSADSGQAHGLAAVAAYPLDLADAEFRFVEGVVPGERTLDLGASEFQRLLAGMAHGEAPVSIVEHAAPEAHDRSAVLTVCPKLGFADDPTHHYSRPTALHRCFASPTPSLIANNEQLDLCLSDRFPTCERFRNAAGTWPAAPAAAPRETPPPEPAGPEQRAAEGAADETGLASRRWSVPFVGRGVAAVLALVGMAWALVIFAVHRPQQPIPAETETAAAVPIVPATAAPRPTTPPGPLAVPRPAQPPTRPPTRPPTPLPTRPPTPTAAPELPAPTAVPRPPVVALMDVRFTAGPADNWLDNPPYAAWSDGAYRLQARDLARFVAVGVPIRQDLDDAVVSATFRKTGGPPGGGYGLILRDQGPPPRDGINQEARAYVFEAGDLGEFGVWRRDGDHWVDLVPWTHSTVVRSGGSPNDLTVRAIGPQVTFTINGVQVAAVEDDALASGGVGIFVGGDYNEVALDHFAVHLPD